MHAQPAPFVTTLNADSLLGISQKTGLEYVLRLDPDRLLAPCYAALGRANEAKGAVYGGWESRQIAGHSLGHYLSALAEFIAATGDGRAREKLIYTVHELATIQRDDGYLGGVPSAPFDAAFGGDFQVDGFSLAGYWVPWYSVHKIYAGLIDAYRQAGLEEALEVVRGMADWAARGLAGMTDDQIQRMLRCEHGGMVAVFADLYEISGEERYLSCAERLVHRAVVDPLMQGLDRLQGLHANTQIPKIIGVAKLHNATGKEEYRRAAETFHKAVTGERSYAIGGNSIGEHFGPLGTEALGTDTCETCNSYNMLALTELLFAWNKDARYADFYEKALYNHILASQEPHNGAKTYFMATNPGHFKVYGTEDNSFWCCTGTGMENPARYNRFIWQSDDEFIYLNLFASSRVVSPSLELEVAGRFPEDGEMTVKVQRVNGSSKRLKIRRPHWLEGKLVARCGNNTWTSGEDGWLLVDTALEAGMVIRFELPFQLRLYRSRDDDHKVAILYGPLVLAARMGREDFPANDIVPDHLSLMNQAGIVVPAITSESDDPADWLVKEGLGKLDFTTRSGIMSDRSIRILSPYFQLHHERYALYLYHYTAAEWDTYRSEIEDAKRSIAEKSLDMVFPGKQQSEIEHGFNAANSHSGYLASVDSSWRDVRGAGGYFAYRMHFAQGKDNRLIVRYYDRDGPMGNTRRHFVIRVNGQSLATVDWQGSGADRLVEHSYMVPAAVLADLTPDTDGMVQALVRFETMGSNTFAGGVFGLRVARE